MKKYAFSSLSYNITRSGKSMYHVSAQIVMICSDGRPKTVSINKKYKSRITAVMDSQHVVYDLNNQFADIANDGV